MNDSRGYSKALEGFAKECGASLHCFYREAAQNRRRNIHLVLDTETSADASGFLRNLRTQPVDIDGCGKPCKEPCAEVLEDLPLPVGGHPMAAGFTSVEYSSAEELNEILQRARTGLLRLALSRSLGPAADGSAESAWVSASVRGALLAVAVRPGRRSTELTNLSELRRMPQTPALCADLHAQPREGEANEELLRLLSKKLHLPVSSLSLISGGKARDKQVLVEGLTPGQVATRLLGES
ncbi:unnamed protein product [Polarella glacialis]|nr:unnamed protein product [Polarella glacialis]CAE8701902.1 unnamed protein product [Polarella glacialis]